VLLENCNPEGNDGLQTRGRRRMELHARLAQKLLQNERLKNWRRIYSSVQQRSVWHAQIVTE